MIKLIIIYNWTFVKFLLEILMYRGCNKTALASQRQIADAFVLLLKERPYPSISISQICKTAGVSRQTFYSLFESKENIILYELSRKHHFIPGETCGKKAMDLKDLCQEYSSYIVEKKDFLSLLVRNDIIYLMHDCLCDSFSACSCFEPDRPDEYRSFMAEFLAGGLSAIARNYIVQGGKLSASELNELIYAMFSGRMLR